ncbi:hypothetical protein [Methylomonas rivi]|uniref:Tetratricopeptide repeat protein n=1 Tax=Methylomonas rivi TaxID=2952226 RepID=A0ABT1U3I8_9GAMM|nr:hypothetical protein [Methylomonas sp. WSC-6]MBS4051215.1 hypothetical protein [Methylomonas sp.]MCQ8127984.1 hypothetical protein [Methylomonas sp. WSC-6]
MTQRLLFEERVLFSPNLPEAVNQLLQQAVAASHAEKPLAEKLFKQAQQLDPGCLQTYFALYKFYFYQGRLQEAEREVLAGLNQAARQGNFPADFRQLAGQAGEWDMYASDTALFYLYTLKALAFIKLRQDLADEARAVLAAMEILDPQDKSGASVIMQLSAALEPEAA